MSHELPTLYEANSQDAILESVSIQGRKRDLRQLVKWLNMAKSGQSRAVLVTGDKGIGKSALLNAFGDLAQKHFYCRVLNLHGITFDSPETLYLGILEKLQDEANAILDDALVSVNKITRDLGLYWDREDLIRAIGLVKAQESGGSQEPLNDEQLVKAIRRSVPAIQKMKFSINDSVEKLVGIIVNPWLAIATSLLNLNPTSPQIQEAMELLNTLQEELAHQQSALLLGPEPSMMGDSPNSPTSEASLVSREAPTGDTAETLSEAPITEAVLSETVELETDDTVASEVSSEITETEIANPGTSEPVDAATMDALASPPMTGAFSADVSAPVTMSLPAQAAPTSASAASANSSDRLIKPLAGVFQFINRAIQPLDSALVVVLDDWDRILTLPPETAEALKDFLTALLQETTEQKNSRLMFCVATRHSGISYTLASTLYNLFHSKLLVSGLGETTAKKLIRLPLRQAGIEVRDPVLDKIILMSRGNPFWLERFRYFLQERCETAALTLVDMPFFMSLGIDTVEDLLELAFTRLKLGFLENESQLFQAIASLVSNFGLRPFSVEAAFKALSLTNEAYSQSFLFSVLRNLYSHRFLVEVAPVQPGDDPRYQVAGRIVADYLRMKTRAAEPDLSTTEKFGYLKKILPMSIASGEFDREKTREVLAMSHSLGDTSMVAFLEETLVEHLGNKNPAIRVSALNSLCLMDSEQAVEGVFTHLQDASALVREYALRNLALLVKKPGKPIAGDRLLGALGPMTQDTNETVRTLAYGILVSLDGISTRPLLGGLSDQNPIIRQTVLQQLVEMDEGGVCDLQAPLLEASRDTTSDVRRLACLGLLRYPGDNTLYRLATLLVEDPDISVQTFAADCLGRLDHAKAVETLVEVFRANEELPENVQFSILRALGHTPHPTVTALLVEALYKAERQGNLSLVWATVRSLGRVAASDQALQALKSLRRQSFENEILTVAVEAAYQKVSRRLDARKAEAEASGPSKKQTSARFLTSPHATSVSTTAEPSESTPSPDAQVGSIL